MALDGDVESVMWDGRIKEVYHRRVFGSTTCQCWLPTWTGSQYLWHWHINLGLARRLS